MIDLILFCILIAREGAIESAAETHRWLAANNLLRLIGILKDISFDKLKVNCACQVESIKPYNLYAITDQSFDSFHLMIAIMLSLKINGKGILI